MSSERSCEGQHPWTIVKSREILHLVCVCSVMQSTLSQASGCAVCAKRRATAIDMCADAEAISCMYIDVAQCVLY